MALDPVEKMELCHRFEIGALGAYETLCTRSTLLSLSDVTRIGMENLVLIANAHKKQLKKEWMRYDWTARCMVCLAVLVGILSNTSKRNASKTCS
jgi:hypothetical protein